MERSCFALRAQINYRTLTAHRITQTAIFPLSFLTSSSLIFFYSLSPRSPFRPDSLAHESRHTDPVFTCGSTPPTQLLLKNTSPPINISLIKQNSLFITCKSNLNFRLYFRSTFTSHTHLETRLRLSKILERPHSILCVMCTHQLFTTVEQI